MASLGAIERWDDEADVVVLGSGLSGSVAAIEAVDTDPSASVLIVEKLAEGRHGGSSRCSAQYLYCPGPEQLDDLLDYQRELGRPNPPPEDVLRAWGEAVVAQRPYLERMAEAGGTRLVVADAPTPDFPEVPGSSACAVLHTFEGPSGVWRAFRANVEARAGIRTVYESAAYELVQDPDSLEVYGVLARRNGGTAALRARRAVVMCTGGFSANLQMQRDYAGFDDVSTMGCPANTGDGILMAQKAGASLWHLRNRGQVGGIYPAVRADGFEAAFFRHFVPWSSYIEIAKDGRRYFDETGDYQPTHYKLRFHGHWVDGPLYNVLPVHMIFDEKARLQSPLCQRDYGWNAVAEGYLWSEDNSAEIERGWIARGDTLAELAAKLGRPAEVVEGAVERWNADCAAGRDSEHGRNPARMSPIEGPPYYGVELVAGITTSSAGGVKNTRSQVVAQHGGPIPRLYQAGELGSILANLYQNGSFLTEAIAFGRIAGRNAALESPWDS